MQEKDADVISTVAPGPDFEYEDPCTLTATLDNFDS